MQIAIFIVTVLLAILFTGTAAVKLLGLPFSKHQRDQLKISPVMWRAIGSLELLGAIGLVVGLWIAPIGIAATIGLILFMVGAAGSRVRVARGIPAAKWLPGVVADLVIAVLLIALLVCRLSLT